MKETMLEGICEISVVSFAYVIVCF